MGKNKILTKEQKVILDEISQNNYLKSNFYFTGGTALALFYLKHRLSEDLDFFSESRLDTQVILTLVEEWSQKHKFTFNSRFAEVVYIFEMEFKNHAKLKLDFAYYPYKRVGSETTYNGIQIDSLQDIAINKLLTVSQRTDVKDFVDLYFLLQQLSLWDLIHGVRVKFNLKVEPFLIAIDFLKVEDFEFLPKMIRSLTLNKLKDFFKREAKEIGIKFTY